MIPVFKPILKNKDIKAAFDTIKKRRNFWNLCKKHKSTRKIFQNLIKQNSLSAFLVELLLYTWQFHV